MTDTSTTPSTEDAEAPRYPTLPSRAVTQRATTQPDEPAIVTAAGDRTWKQLDERVNKLVRAMRTRGIEAGQAIALVCSNRPEFVETYLAAARNGLRLTPINWHLGAEEIAYIVNDCEATMLVADERFSKTCAEAAELAPGLRAKFAVGGHIDGFETYDDAVGVESPAVDHRPRRRRDDALHVRHDRTSEGRIPSAAGREPRAERSRPRPRGRRPAPVHRPPVPRGSPGVLARPAAAVGHRRRDHGRLGPRRDAAPDRGTQGDAHAPRPDHVPPAAVASGRRPREVRHQLAQAHRSRRGAVSRPREEGDDRLGRPDHLGVLRSDRRLGHVRRVGRMADEARHRRARSRRDTSRSGTTTATPSRPARSGRSSCARRTRRRRASSTSRTTRRRRRRTAATTSRSATWATSTRTATSSSPTAPPT